MNTFNPLQKSGPVFPLTVPTAFRAWSGWANKQGFGCLQVAALRASFHGAGDDELARLMTALCEVYSRAIFECSLALHFDRADSRVDAHVFGQICELFDPLVAARVHDDCAASGPVCRDIAALTQLAMEAGHLASPD